MEKDKIWYKADKKDIKEIREFLKKMDGNPLPISGLPKGIEGLIKLWSEENKSEFLYTKENNKIVGISQYTYGEPKNNYQNKDIGFLKITIIQEEYRNIKRTINLFKKYTEEFTKANFKIIKWQSLQDDNYVNKLYTKFAKQTNKTIGEDGLKRYNWETTINNLKDKFK